MNQMKLLVLASLNKNIFTVSNIKNVTGDETMCTLHTNACAYFDVYILRSIYRLDEVP